MDMKVTKISYQPQSNKVSCMQRVKHFFTRNPHGIKIKVLLEDVFDGTINRSGWFGYTCFCFRYSGKRSSSKSLNT